MSFIREFLFWFLEPFTGKSQNDVLSEYYKALSKEEKVRIWAFASKQFRINGRIPFLVHHKESLKRHYFKRIPFNG